MKKTLNILKKGLIVTFTFILCFNYLSAQEASWHPIFENFTTTDGLPSMECYHSCQDDDGYMWFATDRGVVRYNGEEFKVYTTKDGLESNVVFKIVPDDKGRVWFLSDIAKLCYYENGKITSYKYNSKLNSHFNDGMIDCYVSWSFKNDAVLLSTVRHHPIKINKEGKVKVLEKAKDNEIGMYLFEEDGEIINSKVKDLVELDFGVTSSFPLQLEVDNNEQRVDHQLTNRKLKVGRISEHEYYYTSDFGIHINSAKGIVSRRFERLVLSVFSQSDYIWISFMNNGVKRFHYNGDTLIEDLHMFKNSSITDVFKCEDNYMWFTSVNDGLFKVKNTEIDKLNADKILGESFINLVTINNEIIISSMKGNLYHLKSDMSLPKMHDDNSLPFGLMYELPRSNEVLLVTYSSQAAREIKRLKMVNGEIKFIGFQPAFKGYVYCARNSENGYLIGGKRDVSIVGDEEKSLYVGFQVKSLETKDSESIWITNRQKLQILNLHSGELTSPKIPILNQRINDILKVGNRTFFGTSGNGILIWEDGEVRQLSSKDGLPRDYINYVKAGKNGTVWLLGYNGLTHLKLLPNGKFEFINYSSGSLMCEKMNNLSVDENYVYIASNRGIIRIKNDNEFKKPRTPRIHFTNVLINDVAYEVKKMKLAYDRNDFVINYDAVSYENEDVIFRYRYNSNDEWVLVDERTLRLNSLPVGKYNFEIQASISGSDWSNSQRFNFEILPPYWKTWWFISLEILFGLGLISWFVFLRLRFVKRKHNEEQKTMQLQQEALTQQMNPHFIFNALGSVQNSILKGDSKQANSYLVKFSRLLRSGLNASRSRLITLEDDKELMENYLTVEKTRLGESFAFDVELISPSDSYSLLIAPFLLQPFVENAIKHGIGEHHEAGHVLVQYKQKEDCIECTIVDNGIGREATSIKRISGHSSHGSDIAFERIELFNKSKGRICEKKIEDLYDAKGEAVGTRVTFTVPIIRK